MFAMIIIGRLRRILELSCSVTNRDANNISMSLVPSSWDYFVRRLEICRTMSSTVATVNITTVNW